MLATDFLTNSRNELPKTNNTYNMKFILIFHLDIEQVISHLSKKCEISHLKSCEIDNVGHHNLHAFKSSKRPRM